MGKDIRPLICEKCHGTGRIPEGSCLLICAECNGEGIVYCCDGLQEQPSIEDNE